MSVVGWRASLIDRSFLNLRCYCVKNPFAPVRASLMDRSFLNLRSYCVKSPLFQYIKLYPWAMACIAYAFHRSSHPCNDVSMCKRVVKLRGKLVLGKVVVWGKAVG